MYWHGKSVLRSWKSDVWAAASWQEQALQMCREGQEELHCFCVHANNGWCSTCMRTERQWEGLQQQGKMGSCWGWDYIRNPLWALLVSSADGQAGRWAQAGVSAALFAEDIVICSESRKQVGGREPAEVEVCSEEKSVCEEAGDTTVKMKEWRWWWWISLKTWSPPYKAAKSKRGEVTV